MYRQKKIKIPVYDGRLFIIDTDDPKELLRRHNFTFDYIFAGSHFFQEKHKNIIYETYYAVFNFSLPENCRPDHDAIAHEATHLMVNLFKQKGVKLDYDNDEPMAYWNGWFVKEIIKFIYSAKEKK
jgi:hypothetical protein